MGFGGIMRFELRRGGVLRSRGHLCRAAVERTRVDYDEHRDEHHHHDIRRDYELRLEPEMELPALLVFRTVPFGIVLGIACARACSLSAAYAEVVLAESLS